ncbi:hypothetical protein OG568_46260 [Streptomyces sp. NBC_01450]|uniref:hypothetical protein n=1 Tax=Streptomyces sp. NBC_01450 TaxID=2903871 RepID=UPI002E379FAC|nr:hypothetical protein [Streptomyces sp. NBC_01450]
MVLLSAQGVDVPTIASTDEELEGQYGSWLRGQERFVGARCGGWFADDGDREAGCGEGGGAVMGR